MENDKAAIPIITNTKGKRKKIKIPGIPVEPVFGSQQMKDYQPSDGTEGPTGETPKDRVYIVLYDHTEYHGGRIDFSHLKKNQMGRMHIPLREKYPGLILGNEYGAAHYDWIEKVDLSDSEEDWDLWDKFSDIMRSDTHPISGGTYSQPLSGYMAEEPAILQFQYGLDEIKQHTGKTVKYYTHSENTGFTYLPQILNDFGYDGAVTRTHWQVVGTPPPYREAFGLWMGPDGSTIKTIPTPAGDNFRVEMNGMQRSQSEVIIWHNEYLPSYNDQIMQLNNYYRDKKSHGADYVVVSVVEDTGFDQWLPKLLDRIKEVDPEGKKYVVTSLEELFKILKLPKKPPVFLMTPNNWHMSWNSGFYGNNLNKALAIANHRVDSLEKLTSFAKLSRLPNIRDNRDKFDRAWKAIINAETHDAHVVPESTSISFENLAAVEDDMSFIRPEIESCLISNIDTNHDSESIVLFNTQAFDRKEQTVAELKLPKDTGIKAIREASSGRSISFDILSVESRCDDKNLIKVIFAADVQGFGHNTYNIYTSKTGPFVTVAENKQLIEELNRSGKITVTGKDCSVTVTRNGEIEAINLKDSTRIIDKGSNIFSGRFHPLDNVHDGHFEISKAKVTSIKEGNTLYMVEVTGEIWSQPFVWSFAVYKKMSGIDFKVDFVFDEKCGIGNYYLPNNKFYPPEAWSESIGNYRKDRLCVNYITAFGHSDTTDPYDESFCLFDADKYNEEVNIARYTPYYPEEFKRESEVNTMSSWPVNTPAHNYDIFSRYWVDFSDKEGSCGFTLLTEGSGAYTYDGRELKYVLARSSPACPLHSDFGVWYHKAVDMSPLGIERKTRGHYSWRYRIVPHKAKKSTTQYKLADGSLFDSLKAGLSYNTPLYVVQTQNKKGSLPPKHRYLLTDTGTGSLVSALRTVGDDVFVRAFEYQGLEWGEPRFCIGSQNIRFDTVSMDLRRWKREPANLTPYKIKTYRLKYKPYLKYSKTV